MASDHDIANAAVAHAAAATSLSDSISYLDHIAPSAPFADRTRIALEKANLQAELARINQDYLSLLSGSTTISAPDDSTVTKVQAAAASLDNMIANAVGVDGLIQGVTALLNAYHGTTVQPGAAMAEMLAGFHAAKPSPSKKKKSKGKSRKS